MEASPLTRQPPPEVFTPKILNLYAVLFKDDDGAERQDGFWTELFLLRPDRAALRQILDGMRPGDVLLLEAQMRELFARAVAAVKGAKGNAPSHALDTLSVFLSSVASKRYAHPSSDIIAVLAGLDRIDTVFSDFVSTLDGIIRNGSSLELRYKAIEVVLAITAGAYHTTLLTYMIQRDLFPSVMKFIQDSEQPAQVLEPFTLLGILANYNKFEFQNPYQLRLNDFVNETAIQKNIRCVGYACQALRSEYVEVQDDLPEGWTLSSTLSMIGLGAIAPGQKPEKKVVHDAATQKQLFTSLPGETAAVLLAAYDFAHANKLFCFQFVTLPAEKGRETPIASYLSLTSYVLQHAHLSQRATCYAHLNLMVFRLLIEDAAISRRICSDESRGPMRLCRQRHPYLPLVKDDRVLAAWLLDTMLDGVNHNLKRRLDVGLYILCLGIMTRIVSYLSRTRTRLTYHWAELFRSLLSLIRFLNTYSADLRAAPHIDTLLDAVVNLVALSLSAGEAFLPSPAAYDDLFYKVFESGEMLAAFRDSYALADRASNSIDTLISVSAHYKRLLTERGASAKKLPGTLTTQHVAQVIKQGYETLSIQAREGLDTWERYREADEKILLKKMARAAVADIVSMVDRRNGSSGRP
ncbi:UPF0588 membrane protein [Escovopsis weberi]|uniref:UPF0588 membrane protein n=1 Tax=Escovopsis weberi TaxID=150374 RepID=A0A0M9VX51_ESCWE|nr:UPF0588 membrane protein [Escovopsis weberi]